MAQGNLSVKQKQTHRHREQTCSCQGRGEVEGGKDWTFGLADTNLYTGWMKNKVLLDSTVINALSCDKA